MAHHYHKSLIIRHGLIILTADVVVVVAMAIAQLSRRMYWPLQLLLEIDTYHLINTSWHSLVIFVER